MSTAVRYRVFPASPAAHLLEVSCTVAEPDAAGQMFRMPVWIPGSYLVREFARNVVRVSAASSGAPVAIEKFDKHTWGAAPVAGPLTLTCEIYAWDLSVRAAHFDQTHCFFNGPSVFLAVQGQEHRACEVELLAPEGEAFADWRVATAMERSGAPAHGFGIYRAENYDELIDHPVELGNFTLATFEACGVPHEVAITGRHRAELARLTGDLRSICEHQMRLFGEGGEPSRPMRRYLFLVMAVGEGYGGLEHRASTALICSRDDLPRAGESERSEKYRTFLGLASHEYFHTWNVKRIKPAAFTPYDLARENYTRQLWAFEGITSYYDDLVLVRSGLITQPQYLQLLGENITRVLRAPGRLKQSVAESSFDAWIKFYRPDENSPNAVVSYYTKGALVALALDLTVRAMSGGARSLDDLMRALWRRYGSRNAGVPEDGVQGIAEEVAGAGLAEFFARYVYGTEDPPLAELLGDLGIALRLRAAEGAKDSGGKPGSGAAPRPVLGVKVNGNREARLAHVYDGGAAQAAGLAAGDVVIAVEGLKVSGADLESKVASYPIGTTVNLHAFRRDELMTFGVTLAPPPAHTCWLEIKADAPDDAVRRRTEWLS